MTRSGHVGAFTNSKKRVETYVLLEKVRAKNWSVRVPPVKKKTKSEIWTAV